MDEEPRLPIELGPVSNGEHIPFPTTEVTTETARRMRLLADANAPRRGMSRREFLHSSCGAAAALVVLAACHGESRRSRGAEPGGTFSVPSSATTDPAHAREVLGGDEFIFDVQTHLLEFDRSQPDPEGAGFAQAFPYASCGASDWRECFGIDHWVREVFVRSDTTMAVISAVPLLEQPNPLSIEVMERARATATNVCGDRHVFLHGQVNPNVGDRGAALDHMRALAEAHPIAAWKVYTHVPFGRGWWLDDHEPGAVQCGQAFIDTVREVGPAVVCVHKGLGGGSTYSSPVDIGPAAKANPDITFVVYHSGYDGPGEGPYARGGTTRGIDRLLASLDAAGIDAHSNVYAELGSTWFNLMRDPTQAAHALGKLINRLGEDRVLWGTDSIWYGSPQSQIEAMRTFRISDELQDRYEYPAITDAVRRKIFGTNAAGLYGVDPNSTLCKPTDDALSELRGALPPPRPHGPTSAREALAVMRAHAIVS
jgi:hypothetical protein